MSKDELRRRLIDGTIHVIAEDGLDKATTKQIGTYTNTNEAYIYRCFANKEDMLAQTFNYLDQEVFSVCMEHVKIMYDRSYAYETRCRFFFFAVWDYFIKNRDGCLAYVRYFYSPYFLKNSFEDHKKRYQPLVVKFEDAFIDEAAVWLILNHILNVMLDFAIKVHSGLMLNTEVYSEHVFRVVYNSIKQYFKHE